MLPIWNRVFGDSRVISVLRRVSPYKVVKVERAEVALHGISGGGRRCMSRHRLYTRDPHFVVVSRLADFANGEANRLRVGKRKIR